MLEGCPTDSSCISAGCTLAGQVASPTLQPPPSGFDNLQMPHNEAVLQVTVYCCDVLLLATLSGCEALATCDIRNAVCFWVPCPAHLCHPDCTPCLALPPPPLPPSCPQHSSFCPSCIASTAGIPSCATLFWFLLVSRCTCISPAVLDGGHRPAQAGLSNTAYVMTAAQQG